MLNLWHKIMAERYREAGVDLRKAEEIVGRIGLLAARTLRPETLRGVGGFAALTDPAATGMRHPLLASSCDGVGTKLKIAMALGRHDTIGIDAVAMNVNDILTCGAVPLGFMDYIAVGKIDAALIEEIVKGVAEGCRRAGCSLTGGETAEMPDMYAEGEYDLAGFATGAVEKDRVIDGHAIAEGDILLALPSSGLHSNGFSLVRKILSDADVRLDRVYPELDPMQDVGSVLLTPTRIYSREVLSMTAEMEVTGIAHVTGGGLEANLDRILPSGFRAVIDRETIRTPRVFGWLQKLVDISDEEMAEVFNMGVGMVMAVRPGDADRAIGILSDTGCDAYCIGEITK